MNSALPNDTDGVVVYSQDFEHHELRKVLYDLAHQNERRATSEMLSKSCFSGWNWRAYAGTDISNAELNLQIEEVIESKQPLLEYFAGAEHTLGSVDFQHSLDGRTVGTRIQENFNAVYRHWVGLSVNAVGLLISVMGTVLLFQHRTNEYYSSALFRRPKTGD